MKGPTVFASILRGLRHFVVVLCLMAAARVAGEEENQNNKLLADCAQRLGEAQVKHWLIEDLARQFDRALSYQPDTDSAQFQRLQAALNETHDQLDQARSLYKRIYNHDVENHAVALHALLEAIVAADNKSEGFALILLNGLGQKEAGPQFQALPVRDEDLRGAWGSKLIGNYFKPKRMLFGSSGKAGDNRLLPLDFDFSQGLIGQFVPMPAIGEVKFPDGMTNQSAPAYSWMKTNHVGYHYWAGIYNKQNTYIAPWFMQENESDDDVWLRLEDEKYPKRTGEWAQVNIWNRHVQDYLKDYAQTQARALRNDPFLVCYDYATDPHPYGAQAAGQAQYSGYNDSALKAFHERLQQKYKTIENLNALWKKTYPSFESIKPPPDPFVTFPEKATPLSYEFNVFRFDSQTRFWKSICDAFHRGDPFKPVVANVSQYMSGWPVEALDAYGMQKNGAADWFDMHMNNYGPNIAEQIYLYSLCRMTKKTPVQFEYVWTFPRVGPVDETNETDFQKVGEASVWRNMAWGKKALVFQDADKDAPGFHNALLDREVDYSILRPSACIIPTIKRRTLRYNEILAQTELPQPDIIVLQPTTSILNGPPFHPSQSFGYHLGVTMHGVHDMLFPKNYPFLYLPEEAVTDERYDLSKQKVIILPEAAYLPVALTEKIMTWVKNGGTLICCGVPGVWNAYGVNDLGLVTHVFGRTEVKDTSAGKWKWDWKLLDKSPDVEVITNGGKVIGAAATFWKGRMLVATADYSPAVLQKLFYAELDRAIGSRPFVCAKNAFEVVLRDDGFGHKYLFVLNPHTREVRKDEFLLPGNFSQCLDLGIGSGVPMPVAINHGTTKFSLTLQPGEGTVIALKN